MLIAITSSGDSLDSTFDKRFGRTAKFVIYNTENKEFKTVDNNQNLNAAQGAGIQAAQNVVNQEVKAVITGHCGPKAFKVLATAGVDVYNCDALNVSDAIKAFENKSLEKAASADVEGHWI